MFIVRHDDREGYTKLVDCNDGDYVALKGDPRRDEWQVTGTVGSTVYVQNIRTLSMMAFNEQDDVIRLSVGIPQLRQGITLAE